MKQKFIRIIRKPDFIPFLLIILTASFLRLYKIGAYMTFLGDEGRDVIVAREILSGNLTLLGPRASAGDFFLGPIYYYMIAPFLFLTRYDPVGPAIMVALFGIGTVALVYFFAEEFFGIKAALIASILYAISPLVIAYSRSSWNPNPMPFFSLLTFYTLYKAGEKKSLKLFFAVGFLVGIMMQLHYLTVFIISIIGLYVLISTFLGLKRKSAIGQLRSMFIHSVSILLGFMAGFAPFLAFETRHNFPNIRTILRFILQDNFTSDYVTNTSFIKIVENVFFRLFARLITKFPPPEQVAISESSTLIFLQWATIILAFVSIIFLFKSKNKKVILLISLWLGLGVIQFGIYKRAIYDYYFGFLFPIPFLLVGNFLGSLFDLKRIRIVGIVLGLVIFSWLFYLNISGYPFQYPPNRQKDQAKMIAEFIMQKTNNKPFNFALITGGNSDHVYRYFFNANKKTPVEIQNFEIDPGRSSVTDQLFVVCEELPCSPIGHSLWEIAGFGRAEVKGEWDVSVVKIYELVHYEGK